jgi:hypothetical protein
MKRVSCKDTTLVLAKSMDVSDKKCRGGKDETILLNKTLRYFVQPVLYPRN